MRPTGQQSERGSAILDFTLLAVVLIVPLVYLVLLLARLHAASFAVTAAAREAGRAAVTSPAGGDPEGRARTAAALAFQDQGFPADGPESGLVTIGCSATPCLSPEAVVTVRAELTVEIPLLPTAVTQWVPARIPVSAGYRAVVDRYRGRP